MADGKASKTLKTVAAILFFSLMIVLSIKFARQFMFDSNWGVFDSPTAEEPTKQYKSTTMPAYPDSDMYYFKLEDLNGALSASMSGAEGSTYYSMTIVLGSTNKDDVLKFQKNTDLMASIIRDTMSTFRPDDLRNEDGKEYFKSRVKERIVRTLGIQDIDAIYFEKFLFQPVKG